MYRPHMHHLAFTGIMSVHCLPNELLLYVTELCDRTSGLAFTRTCHRLLNLLSCKRRCVLLVTPIRMQFGMLTWLNQVLDDPHMVRMGALSLDYRVPLEFNHLQFGFLFTLHRAMTAFHTVRLVIQNSPMSTVGLIHALQNMRAGGSLTLDLSYHRGITAVQINALWSIALRLSVFRLKLHNTDIDDATMDGIAHSIDTAEHPIAWTTLKLGLAHNCISDRGMSILVNSIAKCPNLKDLILNLSYNVIHGPDKMNVFMASVSHIPSVRIKLDSDCWDTNLSALKSVDPVPDHWRK